MKLNIIRFCSLILMAGLVVSCVQVPENKPISFETIAIEKCDRDLSLEFACKVQGVQDVYILPQVSGTITKIAVAEGQSVKKGQTLMVIDQTPYSLTYQTAKANTAAAKASLATAKLNYQSQQELYKKGIVSKYVLETSENQYHTAQASLQMAEAQEANAANDLNHCTVKAPVDGVVGMLPYKIGALVAPQMSEPLTTISDISSVLANFSVNEKIYTNLLRNAINDPKFKNQDWAPVDLRLKDGSLYDQKGKIVSFSGVIDATTGAVNGKAKFPNAKGLLHSGVSATLIYPITYKGVIVIPISATQKLQDKVLAYRVDEQGKAKAVVIKTEPINNGTEYIVTDGLKEGDVIVSLGTNNVHEGDQVVVKGN